MSLDPILTYGSVLRPQQRKRIPANPRPRPIMSASAYGGEANGWHNPSGKKCPRSWNPAKQRFANPEKLAQAKEMLQGKVDGRKPMNRKQRRAALAALHERCVYKYE